MFLRNLMSAAAVAVTLAVVATPAFAEYPEKPIKVVINVRAGGGSDNLARALQVTVEKYKLLPQPIVVVNVVGAGGAVGTRQVKDAEPDGYTYLQSLQTLFAQHATGITDFGPRDFIPVIKATKACSYMAVRADTPYKNFAELVEDGKKNPGKIKYADSVGGFTHFPMTMIEEATGAKWGIVQAGGTSARFTSLKGGHTSFAIMTLGWLERGGDALRPVLYLGDERLSNVPDMPTAKELGIDVTNCVARRYYAPLGTPQDRIDRFADAIEAALKKPEMIEFHKKTHQQVDIKRGDELKKEVEADIAFYEKAAPLVKAAMTANKK